MPPRPVAPIAHLHVHSQYTLLGATPRIEDLAARAAAEGMSHLALTDTNALYGAVAFGRACVQAGVQPIVGMVATVAQPPEVAGEGWMTPGELVLLAKGQVGWRSLCGLSSAVQNRPDREAQARLGAAWETLQAFAAGLICLAGGRRSWLARSLAVGDMAAAARYVSRLAGVYGEDAVLCLELHGAEDRRIADGVVHLGARFGLPVVVAHPVYCLAPEERARLPLMNAIAHNCRTAEAPAVWMPDEGDARRDLHWLSPTELVQRYGDFPAALDQIGEVTRRCGYALPDGRPQWPALPGLADQSPAAALSEAARKGASERYGAPRPEVEARLAYELALIEQRGYAPLFLLVADITRFARAQDIPYNTRGSVANSLVAYCTGITTVDPVEHDLLFERFLNPERAGLPDIDLDLCSRRRDEVLEYVRLTYGEARVALVATVSTFRPKSALRETAKAFGLDPDATAALVAQVRDEWHPDPRRRKRSAMEELLAQLEDAQTRAVVASALSLIGVPHHLSIHPGGVVVGADELARAVPLQWTPKGFAVTQFGHEDVAALGLPKVDLLGIRALTVLSDTVALIRNGGSPGFRLADIAPDDAATARLLATGDTVGVFQCESSGAQRTLRQLRATNLKDLAVANAFFKPGPATGGMAQAFIRRYRGEEPARYLHPALEPILQSTQGVLLFQEQVLRVAREVAGLSWAEADRLRKGMSKFQAAEMEELQGAFMAGCCRPAPAGPGFSAAQAQTLWRQVLAFAGYGFNQGHATAYADVSYRSAYLKAHWPAEFLCARLADWGGFYPQAVYLAEARRLGFEVRPPHVNFSGRQFRLTRPRIDGDAGHAVLWMGLRQVRDLRRATVEAVQQERRLRPFSGIEDLLARVPMQRKEWTHLVQCGALDGLGASRAAMLATGRSAQGDARGHQLTFAFADAAPARAPVAESPTERLAWELRVLGVPVSVHPVETVTVEGKTDVLAHAVPGQMLTVAGARLPGWTGGKGWFLGDPSHYAVAVTAEDSAVPKAWRPILVCGQWRTDEWGDAWLQVDEWRGLDG